MLYGWWEYDESWIRTVNILDSWKARHHGQVGVTGKVWGRTLSMISTRIYLGSRAVKLFYYIKMNIHARTCFYMSCPSLISMPSTTLQTFQHEILTNTPTRREKVVVGFRNFSWRKFNGSWLQNLVYHGTRRLASA